MFTRTFRTSILLASLLAVGSPALGGPLTPPGGPVTSTGKTTQEIFDKVAAAEPRTPLSAATTPGDGTCIFKITQPGSYYLTGILHGVSFQTGIRISLTVPGGVTIDLNGFGVRGGADTLSGIDIIGGNNARVVVRNGYVYLWDGNGVDLTGAESGEIENVHSSSNFGTDFVITQGSISNCKAAINSGGGFVAGASSSLTQCEAINNSGTGFDTDVNCRLTQCTAKANTSRGFDCEASNTLTQCIATGNSNYGFNCLLSCTLLNCVASTNTGAGISVSGSGTVTGCVSRGNTQWGYTTGARTVFQSCTARENTFDGFNAPFSTIIECDSSDNTGSGFSLGGITSVYNSSAMSNTGSGIIGGGACLVVNCNVRYNTGAGIELTLDNNTIRGNLCIGNGTGSGNAANIRTAGINNRIEDNNCTLADRGIEVDGTRSIIVRNTCGSNTQNWAIAANNSYGPIIDRSAAATAAANANSAASTLASTDPNANFSY
ncbi:MAG: right-handed parallel beta-helix repeat-containing protein [Phycisphaerales bacterium]